MFRPEEKQEKPAAPTHVVMLDLPKKVALKAISDKENMRLFSKDDTDKLKALFKDLPPGRYSKKMYKELDETRRRANAEHGQLEKLLADETQPERITELLSSIEVARQDFDVKNALFEANKTLSFAHGIFKDEDESIYAVYNQKLGEGNLGSVKLLQNIETGEWRTVKTQVLSSKAIRELVEKENETLKVLEKSGHVATRHKPGSEEKAYFSMPYAEGTQLYQFLQSDPALSSIQWLDLMLSAAQSLQSIHANEYLHCDVKLQNMIFDPLTGKVQLVDVGLALSLKKDELSRGARGTPAYMAPELELAYNEKDVIDYNKSIDVYAFGLVLKEVAGMIGIQNEDFISPDTDLLDFFSHSPFAHNEQLKKLFADMTAQNPAERPSMDQVVTAIQDFRKTLLPIFPKTTGVIYIEDYLNAKNKTAFIAALQSVDTVFLADTAQRSEFECAEIRRQLEKKGINIRKEVLISTDPTTLPKQANDLLAVGRDPGDALLSHICYFHSNKKPVPNFSNDGMQTIRVTKSSRDYRKEITINSVIVPPHQMKEITDAIEAQIQRLSNDPAKEDNVRYLDENLVHLKRNKYTYSQLHAELHQLEKKLLNIKPSIFSKLYIRQKHIRAIDKLVKQVKSAPKEEKIINDSTAPPASPKPR